MFVIQTTKGQISSDMGKAIYESVDFERWLRPDSDIQYRLQEDAAPIGPADIPVGSIEWTEQVSGRKLVPDNIPYSYRIYPYVHRQVGEGTLDEVLCKVSDKHPLFVKSATGIKGWESRILTKKTDELPEDKKYFFSEVVTFTDEWRAFLFNGKIVDVKQYQGSWEAPLSAVEIRQAKEICYGLRILYPALTVDFGRTKSGSLELIEIHQFISCGLYGFEDVSTIRHMAAQAWRHFQQHSETT